jgi:agmatine deiminase
MRGGRKSLKYNAGFSTQERPMRRHLPEERTIPQGYAMPAEWERHDATWLAWPHNEQDWPGKFGPVPWVFAEIVRILAAVERVHILVNSLGRKSPRGPVRQILGKASVNLAHITFHDVPTNRVWVRDSGPIFVAKETTKEIAALDFKFNAWAKYSDWQLDDALPGTIADKLRLPRFEAFGLNNRNQPRRFVLEGGSIDVNGAGCLLTTEECLLSRVQHRNPGFSKDRIEQTLHEFLGVHHVLWLKGGIAGDDTHGHVDDTARFVNASTIVACVEPDRHDANHRVLKENWRRLATMRDAHGRQFSLAELPMPEPVYFAGQRLPASYANFYVANAGVLVPVFNDINDARALKILEHCFKGRPIIPIYCRDLVWGLGTIHCLTQQQPATG